MALERWDCRLLPEFWVWSLVAGGGRSKAAKLASRHSWMESSRFEMIFVQLWGIMKSCVVVGRRRWWLEWIEGRLDYRVALSFRPGNLGGGRNKVVKLVVEAGRKLELSFGMILANFG